MKRNVLPALLLALLLASPASAQSTRLIDSINTAAVIAHAADGWSTARCYAASTCIESNARVRTILSNDPENWRWFTAKMGTAFASWLVKDKLKTRSPRAVLWFGIAETAAFTTIAISNNRRSSR